LIENIDSLEKMKQQFEIIMVFQKPNKNKSTLEELLMYEEGDKELSPSIWNIDDSRVPLESNADKRLGGKGSWSGNRDGGDVFNECGFGNKKIHSSNKGRYPSQLFVDEKAGEILDKQSGVLASGDCKVDQNSNKQNNVSFYGKTYGAVINPTKGDIGGSSKILHKINNIKEYINFNKSYKDYTMIENIDALEKIKKLPDNSQDIIFMDPPYALGSTVFIDTDGKPKYKQAQDFMNKWDMPDHNFWEEFFKEAKRVLKYGGRLLSFGMDRQLMLFEYYAVAGGLEIKQSLYWYFISNFPKSADVSKMIDKRLNIEREVIGQVESGGGGITHDSVQKEDSCFRERKEKYVDITKSVSELGQKYEGYKYSISPLKQTLESVMVFQKETKNGSVLDDIFAYEEGDKEISTSIWDIDGGRVATDEDLGRFQTTTILKPENGWNNHNMGNKYQEGSPLGRYPSQLFVDEDAADVLDSQSGAIKGSKSFLRKKDSSNKDVYRGGIGQKKGELCLNFNDTGGSSKILHKIGYLDEPDLVLYVPKVSQTERNVGLNNFVDKDSVHGKNSSGGLNVSKAKSQLKNNHPTLKPIKLIYKIAQLLKTPNPQNVFFPFAGSGSEIIGFIKAGFDDNNKLLERC